MKSSVVLDRVFFHFEEFRVLRDHRRRVVAEIVDDIRLVEAMAALVRADVVAGDPVVRMCQSKCKEKHCHRPKADPKDGDFRVQDAGADGGEADRERRKETLLMLALTAVVIAGLAFGGVQIARSIMNSTEAPFLIGEIEENRKTPWQK